MPRKGHNLRPSEINALEAHRLQRRWSYRELAANLSARLDVNMPEVTLYKAMFDRMRRTRATTAHPIRRYLELIVSEAEATSSKGDPTTPQKRAAS